MTRSPRTRWTRTPSGRRTCPLRTHARARDTVESGALAEAGTVDAGERDPCWVPRSRYCPAGGGIGRCGRDRTVVLGELHAREDTTGDERATRCPPGRRSAPGFAGGVAAADGHADRRGWVSGNGTRPAGRTRTSCRLAGRRTPGSCQTDRKALLAIAVANTESSAASSGRRAPIEGGGALTCWLITTAGLESSVRRRHRPAGETRCRPTHTDRHARRPDSPFNCSGAT